MGMDYSPDVDLDGQPPLLLHLSEMVGPTIPPLLI